MVIFPKMILETVCHINAFYEPLPYNLKLSTHKHEAHGCLGDVVIVLREGKRLHCLSIHRRVPIV